MAAVLEVSTCKKIALHDEYSLLVKCVIKLSSNIDAIPFRR